MTTLFLQGIVIPFEEVIPHGGEILFFKSRSIVLSNVVGLQFDHEGRIFGHDNLEIHIGDESLAFRYELPKSWCDSFTDEANELDTYLGVSAGLTITKSESLEIRGQTVKVVTA